MEILYILLWPPPGREIMHRESTFESAIDVRGAFTRNCLEYEPEIRQARIGKSADDVSRAAHGRSSH